MSSFFDFEDDDVCVYIYVHSNADANVSSEANVNVSVNFHILCYHASIAAYMFANIGVWNPSAENNT